LSSRLEFSLKICEMGKLAVKSGMWILYEREYGKLTINAQSKAAMKKSMLLRSISTAGAVQSIDAKTIEMPGNILRRILRSSLLRRRTMKRLQPATRQWRRQ